MTDAGLRVDERAWMQGQLSTYEYCARLRRSKPYDPFTELANLNPESIRAAAGLYFLASSFMRVEEVTTFHLDEPEYFSVDLGGPSLDHPGVTCGVDYLSGCNLTLGIRYSPMDERDHTRMLEGITRQFQTHAPIREKPKLTRSHLFEDTIGDHYQVYLFKDHSLDEQLIKLERGLPSSEKSPIPLLRRIMNLLSRRAA